MNFWLTSTQYTKKSKINFNMEVKLIMDRLLWKNCGQLPVLYVMTKGKSNGAVDHALHSKITHTNSYHTLMPILIT